MKHEPKPDVIDALRKCDSATISNAIEHFKVRDRVDGYANMQLRCQFPRYEPMVGCAITCTADSTTRGSDRPQQLAPLLEAVRTAPKPGVVVIKDVGADPLRSCFVGDMFCTALDKLGVVGIVTDGGFRDLAGIEERTPGFHLFATGSVVSHGHGGFVDFDTTVTVCGLTIRPGDLLHGDANGLLTVPHDIAERVPQQAEVIRQEEAEFFEFLDNEEITFDELKQRLAPH